MKLAMYFVEDEGSRENRISEILALLRNLTSTSN